MIKKPKLQLIFVIVFLIGGCATHPAIEKDYSNENVYMRNVLGRVLSPQKLQSYLNVPVAAEKDYLLVNNRKLSILPVGENSASRDGINFFSARFEVTIDDKPQLRLTSGAVGREEELYNAKDATVINWYYSFGKALLRAVASKLPDIRFENYFVYTGQAQFRGKTPQPLVGHEDARRILNRIASILPQQDGNLHAIVFLLGIQNGRVKHGECRIDGQINAELCELLKGLDWPRSSSMYQRKQAYVLK